MSALEYIRAIQRRWAMVVILGILGCVVGYGAALATPSSYRATSTVLITSDAGSSAGELMQGSNFIRNQVASYVLLARSQMVLEPVIERLNLDTTVAGLAGMVQVSSPLDTFAIQIGATTGSPALAQAISAATAVSLTEAVESISQRDANGMSITRVTTIQEATLPTFPVAPNKRLWTLIGGLVAGSAAVGAALISGLFGRRVVDQNDVLAVTDTPVLGEIVEARRGVTLTQGVRQDPLSFEAESVRRLATNLNFVSVDGGIRSLVVTSASPGESKSHICSTLALALAESSRRVLLIDADLRSPSIADITQLDGTLGLTSVLIGDHQLGTAVQPWALTGLDVLTSGPRPPNPGQLLATQAMHDLVTRAMQEYDMVIVDSPPMEHVADAAWLGHMTDGAIVVTRRGRTTTRALGNVIDMLHTAKVPLLGVVISRTPRAHRRHLYGSPLPTDDVSAGDPVLD